MDGQGNVRVDELGGAVFGDMEGQWNGVVTVGSLCSPSYAYGELCS